MTRNNSRPAAKRRASDSGPNGRKRRPGERARTDDKLYLYGLHTVATALKNPDRVIHKLMVSQNALPRLQALCDDLRTEPEMKDPRRLDDLVGKDAVHQGVVLETGPLLERPITSLADARLVLLLDQVTDPHNVGAILRSATAFNADAVIVTRRHSPVETGVLAKSASGALDTIPLLTTRNLSNTLVELNELGFLTLGLDSEGAQSLEQAIDPERPIALVMGSEGKGLRQKTRETCTMMCRMDMPGPIASLNVSNATALALYAIDRISSGKLTAR
ncbi:23S rRNA (guanosine(2251)-2'-O)-methyltransferase RlmB [Coralliovum pocilloporae]|uniref:23S rRNA (guanosine(2251)-2'-O)-methyltransferase RlmB n=1 Tax=Coralliovum pocilloporae TaxID=3066369 RepID=UPI003306D672